MVTISMVILLAVSGLIIVSLWQVNRHRKSSDGEQEMQTRALQNNSHDVVSEEENLRNNTEYCVIKSSPNVMAESNNHEEDGSMMHPEYEVIGRKECHMSGQENRIESDYIHNGIVLGNQELNSSCKHVMLFDVPNSENII